MAKGTFGERLKRERELREVTLEEISKATRIAPRFMEALENEQWERLPGGVFGRGFVRSVARYLGLNEEGLLSEYDLARGESANPPQAKPEDRIPSPPKWLPLAAGALVVALLAGLFFAGRYAWKAYQARRAGKKSSATVSLPPEMAPAAVQAATAPLELAVAATNATRLRVLSDGSVAYDADVAAGESRRFSASDRFEVTAANSSAVLLELNGRPVPSPGPEGSSGTIVLTAKDTRQATGGDTQR
jgi:hypothetical protein